MKKALFAIVTAILAASLAAAPAVAGDRGWAVAGKVLTGIIGLNILGHAIANSHPYPYPVYAPPPRDYYPPEQVWVPGHYETRLERRWVSGHWEIERGERYAGDDEDGGRGYRPKRYWVPGHYREVEVRLWIPGHWEG
jgi:opacity protein-like surface antigen